MYIDFTRQAVSLRPLAAETQVRSRANPRELFVGQGGSGTGCVKVGEPYFVNH